MSLPRQWIGSPNYSSRGGAGVRLIVLHTAQGGVGPGAAVDLAHYFQSSSSGVSSHVCIDDTPDRVVECVKRGNAAWTQASANPVSVSVELCARAEWSAAEWDRHPVLLETLARWIAEEAAYFGLPIDRLSDAESQGSGRGVTDHDALGSWGGNHWDVGEGFPWSRVLDLAKGGAESMENGYPAWFWDWVRWYATTDRDPAKRPDAAPDKIPEWAWDGQDLILEEVARRYGMTGDERDWLDWRLAGADEDDRPDVYEAIPSRWWDDNAYVDGLVKAAGAG